MVHVITWVFRFALSHERLLTAKSSEDIAAIAEEVYCTPFQDPIISETTLFYLGTFLLNSALLDISYLLELTKQRF